MIVHNRRKRKEFFIEQHELLKTRLAEAQDAALRGEADEDQILLLNRERAADEADRARKNKRGLWATLTSPFSTAGLKTEEVDGSLINLPGDGQSERIAEDQALMAPNTQRQMPMEERSNSRILSAVEKKRRDDERPLEDRGLVGGALDTKAQEVADTAKKSWTSWMSR